MAYKILVVDDEKTLVDTVKAYMENEGYAVRSALDGPAAVREARAFRPDLVVLDIMLPGTDGFRVCESLKRNPRWAHVPILLLSARGREGDRDLGLEARNAGEDRPFDDLAFQWR